MRILIADDDATSRTAVKWVLIKCGHEVVSAIDGSEAWEMLQRPDAPRLAVLDWMMPGIDGPEVCRRVRAMGTGHHRYLMLLTSRTDQEDIAVGLGAGADDYLDKPFSPMELRARVEVGCRLLALQDRYADKIEELQAALAQVKTLRGIVPICAGCKNIRDDKGYWCQVEAYVAAHSEALFSHSLCPDCRPKYGFDTMDNPKLI